MDELVSIMQDVLSELQGINLKLDGIMGYGSDNSITDICDKLDDVLGYSVDNSISDICSKLEDISSSGIYSLSDVCDKINDLEATITLGSNY
ncbi:MAG: hypothetical protein ABGU93_09755 [Acetobacterium sp.]|uniref:hypothetical protein n=1 Tax=Acetobacterium sp. TaxID=1872094 RepID=UPI003241D47A